MSPKESLKSSVEISGIFLEAAKMCITETLALAKVRVATGLSRIDEWLCDYGGGDD